jgi:predicted amidohydrolase
MRIGFVQFNPIFGEKNANCDIVKNLLGDVRADLIVLPELFNTGYTFLNKAEVAMLAETKNGKTANFMLSLAQEKKCCFAYGFAEKYRDSLYNSMSFVSPAGLLHTYRKVQLFKEEKHWFQPGKQGFEVFEFRDVKLGMLICFDWIFPETIRTLALKGAQIILHAANLVMPFCPDAMVTRAIENRVFIVTADRIGEEKRNDKAYRFIGKSQIVSQKGEILIRVRDEECVKILDIDPALALNKKINEYNDLFADRKDDLYFR